MELDVMIVTSDLSVSFKNWNYYFNNIEDIYVDMGISGYS